uniref:Tetratricopeptide repeat domain 6 n=1 Tax=Nannospalax galili TaxID=1026970 RepID=A0A8C6W6P1_NANGA
MSTIPKRFGLSSRGQSYMFKELEKIRQETRKDYLRFKQTLATKQALGESADEDLEDEDEEAGPKGSGKKERLPSASRPSSERPAGKPHGARGAPGPPPAFRPQDFYRRTWAFPRHGPPKKPPAIAQQAGTSKPVVLLPQRWRRPRSRASSPRTRLSRRVMAPGPRREAPLLDVAGAGHRQAGSDSSPGSEAEGSGWQRRSRILPGARVLRGGGLSAQAPQAAPLPPTRVLPKSIEDIIASVQSEAQLASDQTIKELVQSVLGQNYDVTMEDISLMEQMYLRPSQMQIETAQMEAEPKSQMSTEEPPVKVMNIYEELPEAVSSVFQIEQEDILEWGTLEEENIAFKSQEISDIQPAEDSSKPKPSEADHPAGDTKALKRVKSSEMLQIRGREVKRTRKSQPVIPLRPRMPLRPHQDKKLIKKIPQGFRFPHLHDLCNMVPAEELPIDLRLASRVYHTPNQKGHNTLLRLLGSSFLGDHFVDEQRDRILYGVPVKSGKQKYVSVAPKPEKSPELARRTQQHTPKPGLQLLGEEVTAYPGPTKMFWNLTAPKFAVPESTMRENLYPKYECVQTSRILSEKFLSESKESVVILDTYRSFKSLIIRKSASFQNISKQSSIPYKRLKRSQSVGELRKKETVPAFVIKDDTKNNMKQLLFQKARGLERQLARQRGITGPPMEGSSESLQESHSLKYLSLSLIEASRKAGISYIIYPRKMKKKWKKGLKFPKLAYVYEQLSKPPNKMERSTSHGILPGQKKYLLKVPLYERQIRCPSVPMFLNFDKFVKSKGGVPENSDLRTWALETFTKDKQQKTPPPVIAAPQDLPKQAVESLKLELSDHIKCDLPLELIKYYESEVEALTEEINQEKRIPVFAYCRRGAIYRKLGKLQSAMNDLQETIFMEPLFLNAYWHRHFIYLFQDRINDALDDLNYINKYNKNNAEVYVSKAEIFREKKDFTLAILNYSQAIKCRPTDADLYFRRGEMYERTNRVLAIDDYSKVSFIYNKTYRGKAYFRRNFYKQATQDFSVAIHLDPNNWLALYYRACLFRKSNPYKALQDYSVSALINDGYENLSCFLHRGIVYTHLKLWMLAICDFETVIALERTSILAYINIGLIHLLHLDNYTEAFRKFSEAIKIDPLYIQSYICRAETYNKLHKLKNAVSELSRAIHLQPDGIQLYLIRGQYLLMMKCYDLAKFTIYQVAEMNKGLIELSPIQQAVIYLFCENHDKAIQVLDGVTCNRPEIATYALLAKAQMKAKKTKEAVRIFKKALEIYAHSDKGPHATAISADCLYNLGLCYMEEGSLQMAFDSFTKSVKANPEFAEAFYQRGLCKIKLNRDNSILDFNRAITLNPKHYQSYLSRVAYYGLKGRYSKAILNCNEAIRLYPESVHAYICRGVLKYYNKSYKLAITDLTTAINMDKNSYIAFYNRALCYTKIRELEMALRDYGIVLLLEAAETITLNSYINRGLIYTEQEHYGFALEDFKQAALISQTSVSLCQATAMCHHRIKEFEEAIDFFTKVIKMNVCFLDAYVGRGNSYMEFGHEEATKLAQKDFVKALHINPSCRKARISLGYNLQAQGKFQKAWNHFTIAIEADPKNYLAYEGRAVVCLQMSNSFAAIQDINTALKINTTAEFLTNRGVIHEFMGQQQNAMRDYQAAISLDPKCALAHFNAGNIYFHHRQFSQASDYFSKALQFNPKNDYALMNRAVANTMLEKYEEAKEDFSRAIENCPNWAALYFNRASFYFCLKQYELAEEDLSKALSLKPDEALMYYLRAEVRGKIGRMEEAMADYNQALDLEEYVSTK